MSTTQAARVNPNLLALVKDGTGAWLELLRRSLVQGGELARIAEDSLRSVNSNPSIFEIVSRPAGDAEIPGASYSFGQLIAAQTAGDLQSLRRHRLPAERIELEGDLVAALQALTQRIDGLPRGHGES